MRRSVRWSHSAVEELFALATLDQRTARKILFAIRSFRSGQRVDLKKLTGHADSWRIRAGDWRVLVTVDGNDVTVDSVDNRRDAY